MHLDLPYKWGWFYSITKARSWAISHLKDSYCESFCGNAGVYIASLLLKEGHLQNLFIKTWKNKFNTSSSFWDYLFTVGILIHSDLFFASIDHSSKCLMTKRIICNDYCCRRRAGLEENWAFCITSTLIPCVILSKLFDLHVPHL